ncbi:hypothetical protein [Shinella sp.]|uniref:hypothetical protein n=1 Tax=Shinella sp. TaxID=1870904 RepID=UPI0040360823
MAYLLIKEIFEMSLQSIAEYLEPAQDITLRNGLHLYRGVSLPTSDDIRADLGKNLWVFSSEERAREYMRAFESNPIKVIFVFAAIREIKLTALRLNAVTRHLYMSNQFSGQPQTYQRDKLIADIESKSPGPVDGIYDIGTSEILIKNGLLAHIETRHNQG